MHGAVAGGKPPTGSGDSVELQSQLKEMNRQLRYAAQVRYTRSSLSSGVTPAPLSICRCRRLVQGGCTPLHAHHPADAQRSYSPLPFAPPPVRGDSHHQLSHVSTSGASKLRAAAAPTLASAASRACGSAATPPHQSMPPCTASIPRSPVLPAKRLPQAIPPLFPVELQMFEYGRGRGIFWRVKVTRAGHTGKGEVNLRTHQLMEEIEELHKHELVPPPPPHAMPLSAAVLRSLCLPVPFSLSRSSILHVPSYVSPSVSPSLYLPPSPSPPLHHSLSIHISRPLMCIVKSFRSRSSFISRPLWTH